MRNGLLRKGLFLGIIMLFIGTSIVPSIGKNIETKRDKSSTLNKGLVAYWSFDNQSNPGYDDSDNGNQGTLNGVTWTSDGNSGGAVFFDADPDRITFNSPVINTPPYSVCAWVKPTSLSTNYIICNGGETILHYGFYLSHETYYAGSYNFGGYESDGYGGAAHTSYSVLDWTFLCGTWDGTNNPGSFLLYINGVATATTTLGWWDNGPAANLLIGSPTKYPDLYGFFGTIDEVRLYNHVLTPSEVTYLYNLGGGGGGNSPPMAVVDSISPQPAITGQTITFVGHGWDPDNDPITGYKWETGDGRVLSTNAEFSTTLSSSIPINFFVTTDTSIIKTHWSEAGIRMVDVRKGWMFKPSYDYCYHNASVTGILAEALANSSNTTGVEDIYINISAVGGGDAYAGQRVFFTTDKPMKLIIETEYLCAGGESGFVGSGATKLQILHYQDNTEKPTHTSDPKFMDTLVFI
jgi:hypothetical protein